MNYFFLGITFYELFTKALKEHFNLTSRIELHIFLNQTMEATNPCASLKTLCM